MERTTRGLTTFASRIDHIVTTMQVSLGLPCWRVQWRRPVSVVPVLLFFFIIVGCSPKEAVEPYENSNLGISLEKPKNWDLVFFERSGSIVMEPKKGTHDEGSARIEIFGNACVPSQLESSTEEIETNIDRIRILYDLQTITVMQEATDEDSTADYDISRTTILVPTIALPEESARNQVGGRDPGIPQVVDLFAFRDGNGHSIMANIYDGNSEQLNAKAEDIVKSIKFICLSEP